MFEDLKKNIEQEKKIITDIHSIQASMQNDKTNEKFYLQSLDALSHQLILLNRAVPELLKEWSPIKKFIEQEKKIKNKRVTKKKKGKVIKEKKKRVTKKKKGKVIKEKKKQIIEEPKTPIAKVTNPQLVKVKYILPSTKEKKYVTIGKTDRKAFIDKLKFSEKSLDYLKKAKNTYSTAIAIKKPNNYARISNKFFLRYSEKLVPKFSDLHKDLKKANIRFMLSTYLSMAIMSTIISMAIGILIFGIVLIIDLKNWIYILIPVGLASLTMTGFYLYPASEASSVKKKISQELPFASIHMAAIAGSNIEPTKIFKIIAASKEYPHIGREMKKIISQVEIYGYDLVTALKNVAGQTSNKKLAELFSGFATNIATGGELKNFIEKKSENYLLDYRLEREEYSELAGTFMDVYISILIAAPLVLMMMFIVMNVAGLGMAGLSITSLLFLSILGIVVVNIIFLAVLNSKQPSV